MILFLVLLYSCECLELMKSILYGNIEQAEGYYTYLWVGNPPLQQSLLLDTGSRFTAVTCTDCSTCKPHLDPFYNLNNSETSQLVECLNNPFCNSCRNNRCEYTRGYAEGSHIEGFMVEDQVSIDNNPFVKLKFGCNTRETNLFQSQKPNGILGLAWSAGGVQTVIDAYSSQLGTKDIFSLCFDTQGGYLTLGGVETKYHFENIKWFDIIDEHYYAFELDYIGFGNASLSNSEVLALVDSGSTYSYIEKNLYSQLMQELHTHCKQKGNCKGSRYKSKYQPHTCYRFYQSRGLFEFYKSFPKLVFKAANKEFTWDPQYYLSNIGDQVYCVGIYPQNEGVVLGANFMRGKEVIFDREQAKIGLVNSNCNPEVVRLEALNAYFLEMIPQIIVGGLSVFVIVFMKNCII